MVLQNKQDNWWKETTETTSSSQWLGDEPQVSVGGLLEQESSFPEAAQFKDNS